jgi:hypothetical protein
MLELRRSGGGRPNPGRRVLAGALAATALSLAATAVPAAADSPSSAAAHPLKQHDAHGHGGGGGGATKYLFDHGGEILPSSHVYVIWWGPSSAWAADVQSGMGTFFGGLGGSHYTNTAVQYMRGRTNSIAAAVSGTATDSSTPPSNASPSQLAAEASKEFPAADPLGVYFVFTSNFPSGGNFCAWHSYGSVDGVTDGVAYMPNTTNVTGCDPGNAYGLTGSEGLRSLANVTAHEFMESITDTVLSAWYDSSGSEIGDKCAWQFKSAVTLSNGSKWQLQEEWSNAASGCVQTS